MKDKELLEIKLTLAIKMTFYLFGSLFIFFLIAINGYSVNDGIYIIPFSIELFLINKVIKENRTLRPVNLLVGYDCLIFLVILYLIYTLLFLVITNQEELYVQVYMAIVGHFIYLFFAGLLATFWANGRDKRSKKRENKKRN
jgi:hypothetical protein